MEVREFVDLGMTFENKKLFTHRILLVKSHLRIDIFLYIFFAPMILKYLRPTPSSQTIFFDAHLSPYFYMGQLTI